jgi:hypothetical protein
MALLLMAVMMGVATGPVLLVQGKQQQQVQDDVRLEADELLEDVFRHASTLMTLQITMWCLIFVVVMCIAVIIAGSNHTYSALDYSAEITPGIASSNSDSAVENTPAISSRILDLDSAVENPPAISSLKLDSAVEITPAISSLLLDSAVENTPAITSRNFDLDSAVENTPAISSRNLDLDSAVENTPAISSRNLDLDSAVENPPAISSLKLDSAVENTPAISSPSDSKVETCISLEKVVENDLTIECEEMDQTVKKQEENHSKLTGQIKLLTDKIDVLKNKHASNLEATENCRITITDLSNQKLKLMDEHKNLKGVKKGLEHEREERDYDLKNSIEELRKLRIRIDQLSKVNAVPRVEDSEQVLEPSLERPSKPEPQSSDQPRASKVERFDSKPISKGQAATKNQASVNSTRPRETEPRAKTAQEPRQDRAEPNTSILHLDTQEFDEIPAHAKNRLNLEKINQVIDELNSLLATKYDSSEVPDDKLERYAAEENEETQGFRFFTERDIREECKSFRLNYSGMAILSLLRIAGRIKRGSGAKPVRYILINK